MLLRLSILLYHIHVKPSTRGQGCDTSNYNENLQMFLKIPEFDTWTRIRI